MDSAPPDPPSKSQKKREMLGLQAIGEALVELNDTTLKTLELPDELSAAIREMRRTRGHEGKRRQMQYIGRIMRQVDSAPIAAKLEQIKQPAKREVARLHHAERWRDRLIKEPRAFSELEALRPAADLTAIQQLVHDAREEAAQKRPPKAFRELFRALSVWLNEKNQDFGKNE
jgi:ribosome-associated protein